MKQATLTTNKTPFQSTRRTQRITQGIFSYAWDRIIEGRQFIASIVADKNKWLNQNRRLKFDRVTRRNAFRANLGANIELLEGRAMMATLAQGDIAIIALNSANPDTFAFTPLKNLDSGDVINFTDNGFTSSTAGRTGEGFLTYTAPSNIAAGTVISWSNGQTIAGTGWSSASPTNFAFNGNGDQLFAFTGATGSWASQSGITLLFGFNFGTALSSTSGASNTVQPAALSTAFLNLPAAANQNTYYAGGTTAATSVTLSGTPTAILGEITTTSKWFGNSTSAATFPSYTVNVSSGNVAPTITTPTSVSVTSSTATLGGNITANGGATVTASGIVYAATGTNNNPVIGGSGVTVVSSSPVATSGVFTVPVTGLAESTGYSFKAFATNSVGTTYTTVSTFTTQGAPVVPSVTSPTSTAVTFNSATLGGNVTSDGNSTITARGVVYALTSANSNPQIGGTGVTNVPGTAGTGVFTVSAAGLVASSSYSFVAYATNGQGTTYSTVGTFTTAAAPIAPTVTSPSATGITASSATLGGNVTADGNSTITARGIVYALTSANTNPLIGGTGVTNLPATLGTGTGIFSVSASSLTADSGYSYAAYATNSEGTSYSPISTFNTLTTPSGWNFGTTASSVAPSTTSPVNASLSNLTRGNLNFGMSETLIQINSNSSGYAGASGGGNATVAAVGGALNIASSAYFEFTITPNTGFQTALTAITFGSRSTGSGPLGYAIRSSANGYSSDLATGTLLANSSYALQAPSLTSTTSTSGVPLTYRIYGFGGSATVATANASANWRIDDLLLYTTTSTFTLASPSITVTAPNATYTGLAYTGANASVSSAGLPAPVVGFTYYVGTGTGGTSLGSFAPINVGTYTVVGSSPANGGNNAATSDPVTFDITAKAITVTAVTSSKTFDGTTSSTGIPTLSPGLVGVDTAVLTQAFDTAAVGTGKTLIPSAVIADGNNGANYAVTYVNDTTGVIVAPAPTPVVTSVLVNGLAAGQRSQVTSLVVNFNTPVAISTNAFSIENIGLYVAPTSPIFLDPSQIIISPASGYSTSFTVTFNTLVGNVSAGAVSGSVVKRTAGGNSLADGNYKLSVDASKVTNSDSLAMSTGFVFGGASADNFFRMYGDSDGDGFVSGLDLLAFRQATTKYNAAFDWDGDSFVRSTGVDYTNFTGNYNKRRRVVN